MTTNHNGAGSSPLAGIDGAEPGAPKYEVLRAALARELKEMAVNDALPSERDLMSAYGVSRMTVRKALDQLVDDGLIYRVQGSGTYVAPPETITKSLRLTSFSEDIRARHMVPGSRLLSSETTRADVAQALSLVPGTPVLHLERLRTADGSPMCLENVWLPADLASDLAAGVGDSLYQTLLERGVQPHSADQHIRATVVAEREADLLGVPAYSPALLVTRVTFERGGKPIERAVSLYRADRYDFRMTVTRGGGHPA
jgi:GntR family transcriptional regulator